MHKEMPQTIEDGERFGTGDTAFRNCFNFLRSPKGGRSPDDNGDVKDRLNPNGAL